MLYWKRMLVPTKLIKLLCLMAIAVSVTLLSFHLITKNTLQENSETALEETKKRMFDLMPVVIYILHWKNPTSSVAGRGDGSLLFQTRKCKFHNCYLTDRSSILPDYTSFSVVIFDSSEIYYFERTHRLPRRKGNYQRYVFVSADSAADFPVCSSMWNSYFNWAWTYKLDSDLVWRYFIIRNKEGKVIGPKKNMHWLKVQHMNPVDSKLKKKLQTKTKMAAWFASNCKTESHREDFINKMQNYLSQYKTEIDMYGKCGYHVCPMSEMNKCLDMLAKDYFFYLAFENAISEDYVTDILLHALQHDTVPVVLGGANYTRFLPEGSYLNALQYGPEGLVRKMFEIMQNPSLYQMFFKWKNHYSYHAPDESPETDNFCKLCALLNDEDDFYVDSLRVNFTGWWTPLGKFSELFTVLEEDIPLQNLRKTRTLIKAGPSKDKRYQQVTYGNGHYVLVTLLLIKKEYRYAAACSSYDDEGELTITISKVCNDTGKLFKIHDDDVADGRYEDVIEKLTILRL